MRRKSERNKAKASPEKVEKEKPRRGRPSRKRKKSSSEEDAESAASGSEKDARQDTPAEGDQQWRVKAGGDPGHPHKLKICLARPTERSSDTETRTRRRDNPPPAPVQPEPEPERRRSRHRSRRVSNREPEPEVEQEPEPIPVVVIESPKKGGKVKEIVEVQVESKIETPVDVPVEAAEVEPVDIPKVVPVVKARNIEPVVEATKVEPVVEAAKVEPVVKTRKAEIVVEASKDESVVKAELVVEPAKKTGKVELVVEAPKVEPAKKTGKVEPVVEAPKIEPVAEAPKVELVEARKIEPVVEVRKIEPVIEVRKVETVVKAHKVEPVVEVPKLEPIIVSKAETTAEIISETKCVIKRKSEPKIEPIVIEKSAPVPTPVVVPDQSCPINLANESKTTEQPSIEKPVDCKPIETKKTPMDSAEQPSESATKIPEKEPEVQTPVVESSEPKPAENKNQSVCELVQKSEVVPETTSSTDTKTQIDTQTTNVKDVNSTTKENEPEKVVSEETTTQLKSQSTKETPKVTNEKEIESPKSVIEPMKDDSVKTKIVHNYQRAAGHRDAAEGKHSKILTHKDKFSGVKEDRPEDKTESSSENVSSNSSRKRKWGSRPKFIKTPSVNISTDSLKNLISNVEPVSAEEALSDIKPKDPPELKPKKIVLDDIKKPNGKYGVNDSSNEKEIIGSMSHRKISIVNDEIAKLHSPPSPPKYKSSTVLYITNLVRPFTLPQLKNLLQRTGRIVENGFWIDKIKSKCYVQYETEDEAIETRHALHGVTWPVSNPKTLNVDFGSKEAMDEVIASTDDDKTTVVDNWSKDSINRDLKVAGTEVDEKSFEKRTVVREWDLGKGDGKVEFLDRPNNRLREVNELERRKRRSSKSRSPSPARKFKKKEEEAPSKLLDDLFKKTKTTPCIYWLPLNAETILIKEEQRRKHMAEHERRMEELRKAAEEHRMSRHAPHHAPSHRHR